MFWDIFISFYIALVGFLCVEDGERGTPRGTILIVLAAKCDLVYTLHWFQ